MKYFVSEKLIIAKNVMIIRRTKTLLFIAILCLTSCSNDTKETENSNGKDLGLEYEVFSKKNLFPNDNNNFYSGYIILEIPKERITAVDIVETIRNIGIKENLAAAKIFCSKTGYLMEVDSIPKYYNDYNKSFVAFYDLTSHGLNWKYTFKSKYVQMKGGLPIKIDL